MKNLVTLGSHKLKFDFNATCLIEQELGPQIWGEIESGNFVPGFIPIRAMLWAGLHRMNPAITLTGAGDIIQELLGTMDITELSTKLMEGLDDAFPDVDEASGGGGKGKPG